MIVLLTFFGVAPTPLTPIAFGVCIVIGFISWNAAINVMREVNDKLPSNDRWRFWEVGRGFSFELRRQHRQFYPESNASQILLRWEIAYLIAFALFFLSMFLPVKR